MPSLTQDQAISQVLSCFADMGATEEDLREEAAKLAADQMYLEAWVVTTSTVKT